MNKQKLPENFNDGFFPPPTLEEVPKQYLGGTLPVQIHRPDGDWINVKILGEVQKFKLFDAMSCVSDSETNDEEKQIKHFIENGYIDQSGFRWEIDTEKIKDWMNESGEINLSQRFLAKVSNTTTSGNNPMAVLDARRKYGLPPEKLWSSREFIDNGFNWDEYYKTIPQSVKDKALEWNNYFQIQYERITDTSKENFKQILKQCPIFWATATCAGWMTADIIQSCSASPNHMTICEGLDWSRWMWDYDSYDPFDKKLTWNYPIYYPYKVIVIPQPLVLKKKPSNDGEGELMKLYKASNQGNKVFVLGGFVSGEGDAKYHHLDLADDDEAKRILGDDYDSQIEQMTQIPDEQIGESLTTKKKLLARILTLFLTFKGK